MNKSEELCKLLGIEPKCLDEEYSGCSYADDDTRKCCKEYKKGTCQYSNFWIFPDLTKPSNFVKLLKIHPKGTSSFFHKCEDFIHSIYGVKSLEEDIVSTIIDKVFPSLTTRHKNLAKKQAQVTKWDY